MTELRAGAAASIPAPPPTTNRALSKFYFPCLALWISGPLLSLVDTSFIGLSAKAGAVGAAGSAAQLAALGPATTFIDGSLYLFAFLNVATSKFVGRVRTSRSLLPTLLGFLLLSKPVCIGLGKGGRHQEEP